MAQPVTQIQCPNCRNPIQARVQQLIDVDRDPRSKSLLLSGNLNHVNCPVCGYSGQLATPLVYHDSEKELLLTFLPMEIGLDKNEQERIVGRMINRVLEDLPAERRKAYLLQPQQMLTMQGLVERVLEADGITREEIEGQRAKLRLFEELLRKPDEDLAGFVEEHDEALDEAFFQLASLALRAGGEDGAVQAANHKLESVLELSSFGKRLRAQEQELRQAAEDLRAIGEDLTRERLIDLLIEAPNDERVAAIVNLTRPAMDYQFFAELTARIDGAEDQNKERLEALRGSVLALTQQIDQMQQARMQQTASILQSLLEADDLDEALRAALPAIDELFLSLLQANIQAAEEKNDGATLQRLREIEFRIQALVERSLPAGIRLAQQVVDEDDEARAKELIEESLDHLDEQFLSALMATAQRLEGTDNEMAERLRRLHRHAVRLSMRSKMGKKA